MTSLCLGLTEAPCPVVAHDLGVTLSPSAPPWDTSARLPGTVLRRRASQPSAEVPPVASPSPTPRACLHDIPRLLWPRSAQFSHLDCLKFWSPPRSLSAAAPIGLLTLVPWRKGALGQKARGLTGPSRVHPLSKLLTRAVCCSVSETVASYICLVLQSFLAGGQVSYQLFRHGWKQRFPNFFLKREDVV